MITVIRNKVICACTILDVPFAIWTIVFKNIFIVTLDSTGQSIAGAQEPQRLE